MTHLHGTTADERSTGIRDVSALLPELTPYVTGAINLRRVGTLCTLNVAFLAGYAVKNYTLTLPVGFQHDGPTWASQGATPILDARGVMVGVARAVGRRSVQLNFNTSTEAEGAASCRWCTADPMPDPATLPGTQITPPNYS